MKFSRIIFAVAGMLAVGCSADEQIVSSGGAPTLEAQVQLVNGIAPAKARSHVRRTQVRARGEASAARLPPYDLAGTTEAQQGLLEAERIRANAGDWAEHPAPGTRRVVYADLNRHEEVEIEIDDAEIARIRDLAERRGINRASDGAGIDEGPVLGAEVTPQAWSNNFDSRVNKAISATYPLNDNVLSRMGHLNSGCTGTLVGRRLVLTAAHCVVPSDLSFPTYTYTARRSGATAPYGAQSTSGFFYDSQYASNNCHITYTAGTREVCGKWDWALLVLDSNAWVGSPNGTPGWMGYWAPGENAMVTNAYARNDGYPGCGAAESPAGCVGQTLYGETVGRTSTAFRGPDPGDSNYKLIFQTGNDMSPGHSGSAIWSNVYPNSTGGPFVLAIVTNQMCGTCAGATGTDLTHPTMVRSISPWLGGFISSQRVAYP